MKRGRRHTDEEVAQRREAVEEVMLQGRWQGRYVRAIAKKYGVSTSQIYRDRQQIEKQWQEALSSTDKSAAKASLLARARRLYSKCWNDGKTITCAKLLDFEARVIGAYEPITISARQPIDTLPPELLAARVLEANAIAANLARARAPDPDVIDPDIIDIEVVDALTTSPQLETSNES